MRIVPFLPVVLLVACQQPYLKNGQPNLESPYFEVPVDSKVILNHELTIPAHSKNIFFQFGKAMPFYDVNQFQAYCTLTLFAQKQVPRIVKPDTFRIIKVSRQYYYSLARANVELAQALNSEDGETWFVLATLMDLRSAQQPDVVRLLCASWGLPQNRSNVTVNGIRKSLGTIMTLELAQPGAATSPATPRRHEQRPGY